MTFNGRVERRGNIFGQKFAYFDDPSFNRRLDRAAALTGPDRNRLYGKIAVELARDGAPAAVDATIEDADLFSKRIGCQLHQPL